MRAAASILFVGFGSLLAAWVLPMLTERLPHWLQIGLLILGVVSIVTGALLGISEARPKDGISVKMRDDNRIGHIGDRVERR
jgi:hypothetical protein